ncbi:hypothetical protein KCV87_22365 [Actinosynnema pretiosum subsp. pretiosum]|uniref:Uncharacterized protein n=1 Tax=Actinosynnema pretiosum subsp. pretiosum TaxID=103721 RepID=A0AA45L3M0_9PSEU|nr:hypothetical protein KCV87_22365 [Actinosynnema pretiosum subsp. pretiosum]
MTTPNPYDPSQQQPQQGYPQPGYPQQAYPQAGYPASAPDSASLQQVARPKNVDLSFMLWIAAAAVSLIGQILGLLTYKAQAKELAIQMGAPAGADLDAIIESSSPGYGSFVFRLIIIAAWVAVAFAMRGGANWARIVLTVLGGLGLVMLLIGGIAILGLLFAIGGLGVMQGLFVLVQLVLLIGAIITMFTGGASRYFASN